MSRRNTVSALILVLLAVLIAGCTAPAPATVRSTASVTLSPTENVVEVSVIKCPCGVSYTLTAWEDVSPDMMLDCGDGLLQGILFDVTWNQWEETETDTSTGQSETHYTRGHEVLATDQSGKADLFVTSCFCDDLAALDLRIQVVASPGYRLVRRYHLNNHWNFGFQSESVPQEGHIDWDPPHPILCDLRVRQAIAHCIDRRAMIASVYPYIDDPDALLMDSFLPKNHWAYEGPYEDMPQYDPEAGMALLEEAGWTLPDGATVRQNATGEPLTLEFTTTNAQYRQTWGAVFVQNMADCGIEIVPNYVPASWWFGDTTGLVRRDFELGAFAWVSETDPGGRTLYGCNQTPLPSNNWEGQNYMGWCNETASAAIIKATSTVDRNERIAAYDIVQEEFAKDVVSIPLFQRAEAEAWSANLEGVRPDPTEYATTNLHEWTMADGSDTIVIGMTQEPDSLWAMTASNTASALVRTALGSERTHTEYAYDFQPRLQEPLSTIDSGLAANNDVEVNAGDIVLDKYGDAVDLGEWDSVFDNDGNEVEFDGTTPITMKQLVITYRFKPYNWSDGTPGSIADFQLGQKIDCDPEISYRSSVRCDTIQSVDWAGEADEGLEYTVTYLPGAQAPTYFLAPFTPYPSARVLADGRVLADVPAEEWRTLPEINEMPLSWGPYRIVAWDKGRSITLEQNPYYDGGVATPNVVFVLLADRSQALAQLLSGEVDYLDGSTLLASAQVQTVLDAANSTGAVQYEIIVSPTWEHVDINLLIR